MDNFQREEVMASSAAEYVFAMADGKHGVITDEAMGLGIMTLKAFDDSLCQAADEFYVPQLKKKMVRMINLHQKSHIPPFHWH